MFAELEAGVKDMGKTGRSLTLSGEFFWDRNMGNSSELSRTGYNDYEEVSYLKYDNNSSSIGPELEMTYVEPLGGNWSFQARLAGTFYGNNITKDAVNGSDGSRNEQYSSYSKNDDITIRERMLVQYKKDPVSLLFGLQMNEEQNITTARYMNTESKVGKGQWIFNWAPYVDFVLKQELTTLRCYYRGRSSTPSGTKIIPALNLSNPVSISTGNVYLRPQFTHDMMVNLHTGNSEKYTFFELYADGSLTTTPIVTASWFDEKGIRYEVPVNSRNNGWNTSVYYSFNQPFGKQKNFTFIIDGDVGYSVNTGYQSKERLAPIDKENFDYDLFMKYFWGNESGDRFYSGESGFSESNTKTLSLSIYPQLAYKLDRFSTTISGYAVKSYTKYSLDPSADINTWDFNTSLEVLYNTRNGWNFNTDIGYTFYQGYSEGYGTPELMWNAGIAKDIKAFTVSLKVADILRQQKSFHRTTASDYIEDSNLNVLGRYFLIGFVFNFGKMNAAQSSRVENAMWEMSY